MSKNAAGALALVGLRVRPAFRSATACSYSRASNLAVAALSTSASESFAAPVFVAAFVEFGVAAEPVAPLDVPTGFGADVAVAAGVAKGLGTAVGATVSTGEGASGTTAAAVASAATCPLATVLSAGDALRTF